MPLVAHLYELRNRIVKSMLAVLVVALLIGTVYYQPVLDFLRAPYCRTEISGTACHLYVRDIFGQFQVRMKISMLGGVLLSCPIWLYQLGAFITPALHRRERRYAVAFGVAAVLLFATGASMAYITMDRGLQFLLTVGGAGLVTLPDLQSYLSFVTITLLAFGTAFLFPVVLVFMNVAGVLSAARMRAIWRPMVVGIFIMSAVITPSTDPFTFLAMAIPVTLLYWTAVGVSSLIDRGRRSRSRREGSDAAGDDLTSVLETEPTPV